MGLFGPPDIAKLKAKGDVPGLIKALRYAKGSGVRRDAATALGEIGDPRAVEPVVAALGDSDQRVREAATEALDKIGGARAARPFGAAIKGVTEAAVQEARPSQAAAPPDSRVVRVFISSTFRDMGAERDELVKRTFPALRKLCESRGVTWGQVDLRWGITKEQSAEGQVLPICLKEIARCRPYFIGLLGERYGWVPDALDRSLLEREPWLSEQTGHSVTELEILHGVLRDPAMADHAVFYFRDSRYVENKPADQFREIPTPEEIAAHGPEEAEHRAADRRAKLAAIKERIRASGLPVHDDYPDPRALGELVLADLTAVIESRYPAGSEPDPLTREAADHEAFATSRAGTYIGRPGYFKILDAHAAGDGPPLVIIGESGSGKSALLANWAQAYRAAHPDEPVLLHFVGASARSSDWAAMVRRIIGELKRHFDLQIDIPDKPDALRVAFANALDVAAARGRVVLVVDALNQLDDREGALDLAWLPQQIPANVRLVLSSLPGRPLDEAAKRRWPTMPIGPLEPEERERLIVDYLAIDSRALATTVRKRIAAASQCANPLYLRALLDELRVWGEHETLDEAIARYLSAPTIDSLFELILTRYETDYERDRPGLVGDAFSLLWAARRGLSETELLDLLGADDQPMPRAYWSPLYLAAEQSLTSRSGLLVFFHDYLRQAVGHRYLPDEQARIAAHLRLADYFAARDTGPRKIEELPWQLAQANAWHRLARLLADLTYFSEAWQSSAYEVRSYWTAVEGHSAFSSVDAYRPVLDAPKQHPTVVREVSFLMADIGHMREAIMLSEFMVNDCRAGAREDLLVGALTNLAMLLEQQGDLKGATQLQHEADLLVRDGVASTQNQIASGNNKAAFLYAAGDVSGALATWEQLAAACREQEHLSELPAIMNNIGNALTALGKWHEALERYREGERLSQAAGDSATLIGALTGQANVLGCLSLNEEALQLTQKAAQLCRDLGDKRSLHSILSSQVVLCMGSGTLEQAYPLAVEEEQIARELGDQEGLASTLTQLGLIEQSRGNMDLAVANLRESEKISRQIGSKGVLHGALANQATILRKQGHPKEALVMQMEVEQICRELGDLRALQTALGNQGNIRFDLDDLDGALELYRQKVAICRQIGFVSGLALGLTCQGIVLCAMGRIQEALACADEAGPIAEQYHLTAIQMQMQQIYEGAGR